MFLLLLQQLEQAIIKLKGCRAIASHGATASASSASSLRARSTSSTSVSPRAYDGRDTLSTSASIASGVMSAKTEDAAV